MKIIKINHNDEGQRLDSFLKKIMPDAPNGLLYKYIRTNKLKVNGKKPKIDRRLTEGDEIKFYGDETLIKPKEFTPADYKLDIVYEDENLIFINKPAGIGCQPDIKHKTQTLIDFVKSYLFEKGEYTPKHENSFAPALCNRIDFNTRGLVIAAKNAPSLRIINQKLKSREIRRFYICAASKIPPNESGVITGNLEKNETQNKSRVVKCGGKYAETHYKLISAGENKAVLELEIITGRSHQIRAHLSSIGCPVTGDTKYGGGRGGQRLISHKMIMDFKSDAGILNYLNGRVFEISTDIDSLA